ncbi:hypothetical protein Tco_1288209 [Tanacetum coccineum]
MKADDAKKAIQEMADYSQKWHNGASTKNKRNNTSDGLGAIQVELNNLGREIKKVNERVYVAQVACELCDGPHYSKDCSLKEEGKTFEEAYYTQFGVPFPNVGRYRAVALGFYQRDNGNPSYQERRNQGASIKAFEIQIGQMSKVLQEMGSGSLLSLTETNPRDHVKSISTSEEDDIPLIHSSVPFPGRLKEYDEEEVLKGFKKLQVNLAESATSLK